MFPEPETKLQEPLLESAPLAWRLAPQLCRRDPATGESCAPIHGVWQYLRVLGLVGSIDKRADFYQGALSTVTGERGAPRVLICGAADYAMLAQVLAAFRWRGVEPGITVVDLCETPLMLNRWYADRVSCSIQAVCRDILEYPAGAPYDAVCTDAFFGRFAPAQRPALLAKWRELLRPGGRVITASRLRAGDAGARIGFSAEQARRFRASVLRVAGEVRDSLAVDPRELAERAAAFAGSHITHAVGSAEEIRSLFEDAGFRMEHAATRRIHAGDRDIAGPAVRTTGGYLHVVASRA